MSNKVVVFAPSRPGEEALKNTRWMADCTIEVLREDHIVPVALLDAEATRDGLEEVTTGDDLGGLALFSHGRDDAVLDADKHPVLDRENLHVAAGRWIHAIACRAGIELGPRAVHHGAVCFVGYECPLIVEWDPDALPESIEPLMVQLVTITTRNLARGVREERALRRAATEIAEEIVAWCDENEALAEGHGLEITAQQLADRLCCFLAQEIAPG